MIFSPPPQQISSSRKSFTKLQKFSLITFYNACTLNLLNRAFWYAHVNDHYTLPWTTPPPGGNWPQAKLVRLFRARTCHLGPPNLAHVPDKPSWPVLISPVRILFSLKDWNWMAGIFLCELLPHTCVEFFSSLPLQFLLFFLSRWFKLALSKEPPGPTLPAPERTSISATMLGSLSWMVFDKVLLILPSHIFYSFHIFYIFTVFTFHRTRMIFFFAHWKFIPLFFSP